MHQGDRAWRRRRVYVHCPQPLRRGHLHRLHFSRGYQTGEEIQVRPQAEQERLKQANPTATTTTTTAAAHATTTAATATAEHDGLPAAILINAAELLLVFIFFPTR